MGEFRLRQHFDRLRQILLESQDEEILLGVVNTFAKLGMSESIPLLANYLDHSSEKIREASIEALSAQGEYAVSFLLERLDDDSRVMRVSSIESLAKIGDVSIAPLLENFYQKDKEGRFWILNALRRLNADVARSIFLSLCKDEDVDIQLLSISALSEFDSSEESLEILLELLDHDLWRIRNESIFEHYLVLKDLSPEFVIRQLQEGFENRKYWMIKVMEQRSDSILLNH